MEVIKVENINKTFYSKNDSLKVIDNLSFSLKKDEILAIVGPSGGGKSTILNIIAGLMKYDDGNIYTLGKIGYMFQKDLLFEWRTIFKNVILAKEISKDITKEDLDRASNLLKSYDLEDFKNAYPNELSGGMRQRVALIRTLLSSPDILLLDEPFSALDAQTRIKVSDDVHKVIKKHHLSAILVTHDIAEAISIGDRVLVLSKRPATVVKEYTIDMNKSPIEKRKDPLFNKYFTFIWDDLNE